MSLFAPPIQLAKLHAVRRAQPGERDEVFRLARAVRPATAASVLAAFADLDGTRCDDGEIIHCMVATRAQRIVGVAAWIDRGCQIDLTDLIVAEADRRLGVGMSLLVELMTFADKLRVPIIALVRASDVVGSVWLRDHGGFAAGVMDSGRPAIVEAAFPGEAREEGIGLVRRGTS